jgi:DNA-binding response OmpR family regulator
MNGGFCTSNAEAHAPNSLHTPGSETFARQQKAELSVLLVEDDPVLRSALARDLARAFRSVDAVESAEEAIVSCNSCRYDVVVADKQLGVMNGIELLEQLRSQQPSLQSILISGCATATDYDAALRAGAARVLVKPIPITDLCDAVLDAAERRAGFRSDLHGISLIDVLQLFHHARRSVSLKVGDGQIHIQAGEVTHAQLEGHTGEDAFQRILSLERGEIHSAALTSARVTIQRPFQAVLLDALRRLDEGSSADEAASEFQFSLPPDTFASGPLESPNGFTAPREQPLDPLCAQLLLAIEDGVCCTVVDASSGVPLGSSRIGAIDATGERATRLVLSLFASPSVSADAQPIIEEAYVSTAEHHYFSKQLDNGQVLLLVMHRRARIGLGWFQMGAAMAKLNGVV